VEKRDFVVGIPKKLNGSRCLRKSE